MALHPWAETSEDRAPTAPSVTPVESARAAGLRYVSDTRPGIRRKRAGSHFSYRGTDGQPIHDRAVLKRVKALAIPPAWTDVWICPDPNGHVQATARDAKGRKQYRYHPRWQAVRDETKYERTIAFGQALPLIRERTERDLDLPGLPREKVLAAVVRLLETTLIRVGNDEYARHNHSFGLTTMRDRHVDVDGGKIRFHFRGKSGQYRRLELTDRRLARIVKRCRDIAGQELFQYYDDEDERRDVGSGDVNAYLREITGQDFTAKDFRTWAGTVLAAWALNEFEAFDSETQAKHNVVRAIERVAERLGNTPAVCRRCYVHPAVLDAYLDGSLIEQLKDQVDGELTDALSKLPPEEALVLAFLQRRLAQAEQPPARRAS
ncbi:MAG TPA: DNA topoisomerase IB [Chloroflexota bacterium]